MKYYTLLLIFCTLSCTVYILPADNYERQASQGIKAIDNVSTNKASEISLIDCNEKENVDQVKTPKLSQLEEYFLRQLEAAKKIPIDTTEGEQHIEFKPISPPRTNYWKPYIK